MVSDCAKLRSEITGGESNENYFDADVRSSGDETISPQSSDGRSAGSFRVHILPVVFNDANGDLRLY